MKVAVIAGDGIGTEVVAQSLRVLEALRGDGLDLELTQAPAGAAAYRLYGHPLPEATLRMARESDAVLFGAVGDASLDGLDRSLRPEQAILGLREGLGLYASLRQVRVDANLALLSPLKAELVSGLDVLIVRELGGDVYMGQPRGQRRVESGLRQGEREGFDTMRYAESEVRRIACVAFEAARARDKTLCSVDKANVLETSKLWRQVVTEVGESYPDVVLSHLYADNACMQLIANPKAFSTIVTGNLFGDLLSDAASVLTGSVALAASAMLGETGTQLFEAGHGTALDIAGRDFANPIASIRSASLMLRYSVKRPDLADRVEHAIQQVLAEGLRTADIHKPATRLVSTRGMGDAIVRSLG